MGLFTLKKFRADQGLNRPKSVYLVAKWTHSGMPVPGRMLPAKMMHAGREYVFDGVDRAGARYTLDDPL